jgi:hypothetical protein
MFYLHCGQIVDYLGALTLKIKGLIQREKSLSEKQNLHKNYFFKKSN